MVRATGFLCQGEAQSTSHSGTQSTTNTEPSPHALAARNDRARPTMLAPSRATLLALEPYEQPGTDKRSGTDTQCETFAKRLRIVHHWAVV